MSLICLSAEFTAIEEQLPLDQWSPGMTDNSSSLTVGVLELALGDTIRRLKKRGAVCARLSGVGIAKAGLAAPERRNSDAAAITISLVSPPEM